MKKILIITLMVIILIVTWYGESRKFFSCDDGNYVTVWKTYNNTCYIIPGKYYGLIKPTTNFIESSNTNDLTIYFTKSLPNVFIVTSEQHLKINNDNKDKAVFFDYNVNKENYNKLLYKPGAKRVNDIKDDAGLIYIDVLNNHATDKNGKPL